MAKITVQIVQRTLKSNHILLIIHKQVKRFIAARFGGNSTWVIFTFNLLVTE